MHGRTGHRDYNQGSRVHPLKGAEEMRITFIGHASLLIEANGLSIVSDPWWNGPCFGAQWWPYPLPHVEAVRDRRGRLRLRVARPSRSFPSPNLEAVPGIENLGRRGVRARPGHPRPRVRGHRVWSGG